MVSSVNQPPMKLTLTHRNHAPSASIIYALEKELKFLAPTLEIDEARVHLERSLSDSPPFSISLHLVTPGPDVRADASDHTLRAAMLKAFDIIRGKIEHRHFKRAKRMTNAQFTSAARRLAPAEFKR